MDNKIIIYGDEFYCLMDIDLEVKKPKKTIINTWYEFKYWILSLFIKMEVNFNYLIKRRTI